MVSMLPFLKIEQVSYFPLTGRQSNVMILCS